MAETRNLTHAPNRKPGTLITAVSLLAIAFLTLRPTEQVPTVPVFCLACGPLGGVDLVLNVILFVPLGIGLLWRTGSARAVFVIGLVIPIAIELLQFRVISGRDASLGDVVANFVGTALGAWIATHLSSWWRLVERPAARAGIRYSLFASATLLYLALLLQPGRSFDPYAVQWARVLHYTDAFTGTLNWAVLNSKSLKPAQLLRPIISSDSELTRLTASIGVSGPIRPTRRRAEILRIGNQQSEAMLLGQRDSTILFRAFTRAERLRLRSPLIALPLATPVRGSANGEETGELVISARSTPRAIELSAAGRGVDVGVSVPRTIGLTWSLFAPWEVALEPRWWPANAAWLALIVLPASFLTTRARRGAHVGYAGSAAILIILVSFAVIPLATGMSQTTPLEWGGVFAGIVAGIWLARLPLASAAHA